MNGRFKALGWMPGSPKDSILNSAQGHARLNKQPQDFDYVNAPLYDMSTRLQ